MTLFNNNFCVEYPQYFEVVVGPFGAYARLFLYRQGCMRGREPSAVFLYGGTSVPLLSILLDAGLLSSKSEYQRLIKQKGIFVDGSSSFQNTIDFSVPMLYEVKKGQRILNIYVPKWRQDT